MIEKDYAHDLMNRLVTESQKEMTLHFELRPIEAYLLVSLVGLAVTHEEIPENPKEFGNAFIKAFCDRYRDELPAIVESFELSNEENFLMTKDEFEELIDDGDDQLDDDWEKLIDRGTYDGLAKILINDINDIDDDFVDDFA